MFKRIITAALALIMLSAPVLSVSAAVVDEEPVGAEVSQSETGASNLIYFDATGWKNFKEMYCYIWENGGDKFFGWKTKATMMTHVKDNLYSYDLSKLNSSTTLKGGMKDDKDYCVIFVSNIDIQTYDTTIGKACIGDTAVIAKDMIENPMDSKKKCYAAEWTKNGNSFGPHKTITSIGNIVGKFLCPHENGVTVVGDWFPTHLVSQYFDIDKKLPNIMVEFGINTMDDVDKVMDYISKKNGTAITKADYDEMRAKLEKNLPAPTTSPEPSTGHLSDPTAVTEPVTDKTGKVTGYKVIQSGGGSQYGDRSHVSPDGQEDTILFVLGGVMVICIAVAFIARKKKSE